MVDRGSAPQSSTPDRDDAVRTTDLTRRFDALTAVDSLSLTVRRGEIFGLVGPDGAGKTTTLRMLAAILDPTEGDAWIFGHHTVTAARAVQERIAYMSQRFGLYPDLTVLENLHFYADLYGVARRERDASVERLLAFSNMTPFKKRPAGLLSGGMKQKLGLACALIHAPQLLLLDEPTNGVDPVSRRDFWRILYQLVRDGVTILVSTAYLDEAERCSRVALLHEGRVIATDTPPGLKRLIKGTTLEIEAPDARRAAALLRGEPGIGSVALFGNRVNAIASGRDGGEAVSRALRAGGIEPTSIRTI
ncbi:MAG: ABC transporter ATP-binding protein, partial [Acidobacteria bacterium]|nr:ABC transporter ATP-binding protein [Acidobacteriota bacterium]